MNCSFCRDDGYINRKTGCRKHAVNKEEALSLENYVNILSASFKLGCRMLFILGGEPLLNKDMVSQIIAQAEAIGYTDIYCRRRVSHSTLISA